MREVTEKPFRTLEDDREALEHELVRLLFMPDWGRAERYVELMPVLERMVPALAGVSQPSFSEQAPRRPEGFVADSRNPAR